MKIFFDKIKFVLSVIRFKPFGSETEELREKERARRIYLTALTSVSSKLISMLTIFATVPLTLSYLGVEKFGVWMTLSSIIAMMTFADLGIGNGVLNKISKESARDNISEIRKTIANAFFMLIMISLTFVLIFYFFEKKVDWISLFNIKQNGTKEELLPALNMFVLCFALNIITSLIQKIQMAFQMGFMSSIWQIAASIMSFIALIVTIKFNLELKWLIFCIAGIPALVQGVNFLVFFLFVKKESRFSFFEIEFEEIKFLLNMGMMFFILQVCMAATYTSDNLLINTFLGADFVANYSVHVRLYSIIPIFMGVILIPLWPAYSEAIARGDNKWVRKTLFNSIAIALLFSVLGGGLITLLIGFIFELWLGDTIKPILSLALLLYLWKVIEALGMTLSCYMNGLHLVKVQAVLGVITAIAALTLKILFMKHLGEVGVVVATLLVYTVITLIPVIIIISKTNVIKRNAS